MEVVHLRFLLSDSHLFVLALQRTSQALGLDKGPEHAFFQDSASFPARSTKCSMGFSFHGFVSCLLLYLLGCRVYLDRRGSCSQEWLQNLSPHGGDVCGMMKGLAPLERPALQVSVGHLLPPEGLEAERGSAAVPCTWKLVQEWIPV